ncbi:hypothetical protein ACWGB8_17340 [Kitasatospora sp. NPDC054939]
MTAAVLEFIETVPPGADGGPQLVLARCALRLAASIDANASGLPGLVRELTTVMSQLAETGDGEDELSDLRARRAARRAVLLTETAG